MDLDPQFKPEVGSVPIGLPRKLRAAEADGRETEASVSQLLLAFLHGKEPGTSRRT